MNALFGEDIVEPGVAIRVYPAFVIGQMYGGMPAFAIFAELVPGGWRIVPSPGSFIAYIGPDTGCCALLLLLHLDRSVICKDGRACTNIPTDGISQRLQKLCGLSNPAGQSGAVKVNPVAFHDLALAIQRAMIRIL